MRDNAAVDDGWLCDKGRFGFQMFHSEDWITAPMLRQGGVLGQVSWDEALDTVASGLRATGVKTAVLVEARPRTRRATSCSGSPARRSGSHVDSRAGAPLVQTARSALRARARRRDAGHRPRGLDPARRRRPAARDADPRPPPAKAMRRADARVVIASERPTALDGGAEETVRYPRRCGHVPRGARGRAWQRSRRGAARPRGIRGNPAGRGRAAAGLDRGHLRRARRPRARRRRRASPPAGVRRRAPPLGRRRRAARGTGNDERPRAARGRLSADAGPGLSEVTAGGNAEEIKRGLIAGEIDGHPLGRRPASRAARPGRLDGGARRRRLHLRDRAVRQRLRRPREIPTCRPRPTPRRRAR